MIFHALLRLIFYAASLSRRGASFGKAYYLKLVQKGWIYPPWFLSRLSLAITGADIEFNAEIGPGMFVAHPVGIVVGRGTVIGAEVTLFQGVTFGVKSWHPDAIRKFPKVGNRCYFFSGAAVLGDVTVGNNCVIGAHAVLTDDMPDGGLAIGVPARIYPDKGREAIECWSA